MKYAIQLTNAEVREELVNASKVLMSVKNSPRLRNLPAVDRRREFNRLDRMMTAIEMALDGMIEP